MTDSDRMTRSKSAQSAQAAEPAVIAEIHSGPSSRDIDKSLDARLSSQDKKMDQIMTMFRQMIDNESNKEKSYKTGHSGAPAEAIRKSDSSENLWNKAIPTEGKGKMEPTQLQTGEVRFSDVESFDGKRPKFESWRTQLAIKFMNEPMRFQADRARITYAISYLRGDALTWFTPYLEDDYLSSCPTWKDFLKELHSAFADTDERSTARRQLSVLRQNGSAASYAAEFKRLTTLLGYNEDAKKDLFLTGLKHELQEKIYLMDLPEDFNGLVNEIVKLDGRMLAFKLSTSASKRPNYISREGRSDSRSDNSSSSSTKVQEDKKKLSITDTEYKRRRENNLCLKCGATGHRIADCRKSDLAIKPNSISASVETKNSEASQSDQE